VKPCRMVGLFMSWKGWAGYMRHAPS
jgi:hypothetical protein